MTDGHFTKSVGLLTTHSVMNYGGLLQSYALRRTINEMGFNCSIINYVPEMQDILRNPISFIAKRKNAFGKAMLAIANRAEYKERMRRIREFRLRFLSPVPNRTITYGELPLEVENYDVICCGSDQLWNLSLGDMENGAYLLNFPHDRPAVTYAVSFGDGLSKKRDEIEGMLPYIRGFEHISVREEEGRAFLESQGIESAVCLDPTLLLNKEAWAELAEEPPIDYPYVFVYGFETAFQRFSDLTGVAKRIGKRLGKTVVCAQMVPEMRCSGFDYCYACGPLDFLGLIRNADHVCTNSFHACVFSHLFDTPFSVVQNEKLGIDARKATLLKILGQTRRIVQPEDNLDFDVLQSVGGHMASDGGFLARREESLDYLSRAIDGRGTLA